MWVSSKRLTDDVRRWRSLGWVTADGEAKILGEVMTSGRGVGLMSAPLSAFSGESAAALSSVANQEGSARGMRVVYSRRLNHVWSASAGYSFGRSPTVW